MPLKEKFLRYCEMQRSANESKIIIGHNSPQTIEAYEKANDMKREVLEMIEKYESNLHIDKKS